jgi:thiamine biosynthesis protein ThiS
MKLIINGETREFQDAPHLLSLVDQLGMKGDRVAIELNGDLIPRERWNETPLAEGDKLEIVHFVGGGSSAFRGGDIPCFLVSILA